MTFEDILLVIGEFGRYQRRIYLLICLSLMPCGFHIMAGVFLAAETDFRCLQPHESLDNATYQLSENFTNRSDRGDNGIDNNSSQCERHEVNLTNQFHDSDANISSTTSTVECDSFVYDKSTYALSITTEFNLVCKNSWLRTTAESSFMVGVMLGSTIFGGLSDVYGRKPIFYFSLLLQAISGLLIAASPEIFSYMIFRMLVGSAVSGISLASYVIAFEMVVPKRRLMVGMGIELFFSFGYILITVFAYFITNWRILQIAISAPSLMFLVYWWIIPESARWLVTTGRLEEAKVYLQKASSENGVELSGDTLDNMLSKCNVTDVDSKEPSMFDLMKYPNLRRKSLLLFFIWFVNSSAYYGLSWSTSSLVGNDYVNFAIAGLVEIPALAFVFFTLNRWGRRIILCVSMLLAGTSLLLRIFVPHDLSWLEVALTMMGKLAITASLVTVAVFATEQFPTVIRNIGVGAAATCGMIGAILSSYINYSAVIWKDLPGVIFGSTALAAGLLALLLPETLNEELPESIEDGERLGKRSEKSDKTSSN